MPGIPPRYPDPPPIAVPVPSSEPSPPLGELSFCLLRWLGVAAVGLGIWRTLVEALALAPRYGFTQHYFQFLMVSPLRGFSALSAPTLLTGGVLLLRRWRHAATYMLIWSIGWFILGTFRIGSYFSEYSHGLFTLNLEAYYDLVRSISPLTDQTLIAIASILILRHPEIRQLQTPLPQQGAFTPIVPEQRDGA